MPYHRRARRRWIKLGIVCVAMVLFAPYLASRVLSSARCVSIIELQASPDKTINEGQSPADRLRVVSFNMAHGRGLAASNWDGGSFEARMVRLDEIAAVLDSLNADVVILNEVDFNCSWSHGINQAHYLAEAAGYPYRVEQRNFDMQIAWWSWRFGNAILSRLPVLEANVVDLPGYVWWETALAGKKRGIWCELQWDDRQFVLIGIHLSSRSETLRVESAEHIITLLERTQHDSVILAGDMNASPPGFTFAQQDDNGRNTMDIFVQSTLFRRRPDGSHAVDADLTFSSNQPDRAIDWILIPPSWEFVEYIVHRSDVSDHGAVLAVIEPGEQRTDEQ